MNSIIIQKTIKKSFSLKGRGVHFNKKAEVTFHPAEPNTGIRFLLLDNDKKVTVSARMDSLAHTYHQLSLKKESAVIHTVEHLLSALYGLGVSNCLIETEDLEIPILDGSSYPFVEQLLSCGLVDQDQPISVKTMSHSLTVQYGKSQITVCPSDRLEIYCGIDYEHPEISNETFQYTHSPDSFVSEISKARTFGFLSNWEYLKSKGYALGSSIENTLVFDSDKLINPPYRYSNECTRHKILDFMASLSLLEYRVNGRFHLNRSGHSIDIHFVSELDKVIQNELNNIPG